MDAAVFLAVAAAFGIAAVVMRNRVERTLSEVAEQLGLVPPSVGLFGPTTIAGDVDGFGVAIRRCGGAAAEAALLGRCASATGTQRNAAGCRSPRPGARELSRG